jgi:Protein of unknown function (DUF5818)
VKRLVLTLAGSLLLLTVACSQKPASTESTASTEATQSAAPASSPQTFKGEIMDSMCAGMGSHDQMLNPTKGPKNARECTLECVKMGAKYVLYDRASKTTYQLDDQTKPEQFAGQQVQVTGTYNAGTSTIHVENIQAASS